MKWVSWMATFICFLFTALIVSFVFSNASHAFDRPQMPLATCWLEYDAINIFPVANGYLLINNRGGMTYVWKHPAQHLGICDL